MSEEEEGEESTISSGAQRGAGRGVGKEESEKRGVEEEGVSLRQWRRCWV
jgi:hypothetical protein